VQDPTRARTDYLTSIAENNKAQYRPVRCDRKADSLAESVICKGVSPFHPAGRINDLATDERRKKTR
jgi:hypothetical protein